MDLTAPNNVPKISTKEPDGCCQFTVTKGANSSFTCAPCTPA